jgi:hypothetical protein
MRTSAEKARRSQLNVFARLAGCAYLIYIIAQLFKSDYPGMSGTMRITIAVVFVVLTAALVAVTVVDFIKNLMAGSYKADFYTDDFAGGEESDIAAFRARQSSIGAGPAEGDTVDGDGDSGGDGAAEIPGNAGDAQSEGTGDSDSQ